MSISAVLAFVAAPYAVPGAGQMFSVRGVMLLTVAVFKEDDDFSWSDAWSSAWEDESISYAIVLFGILLFSARIIVAVVLRSFTWYARLDDLKEELPAGIITAQQAAAKLRTRAKRLRRTGQLLLAAVGILVLLGFMMFQGAESGVTQLYYNFAIPLRNDVNNLRSQIESLAHSEKNASTQIVLANKQEALKKAEVELSEMSPPRSFPMYLTLIISAKIAAIVFLVFLVQLFGSIYRYVTRLAFFADSRADVLELVVLTPTPETLFEMLVPEKAIEMDQMPGFPVLDQLRDVLKTLNGRGESHKT